MTIPSRNPKPTADLIFRKLFGGEENVDLLIALINSVVGPHLRIVSAEIKNPFNLADYKGAKESIVDIKARADDGNWYIVEMQLLQHPAYNARALFSTAKSFVDQLGSSKKYSALNSAIGIHFLGFKLFPDERILHRLVFKDSETNAYYDQFRHLQLFFVELPKFQMGSWETLTPLEKWLVLLTMGADLQTSDLPFVLQSEPAIVKSVSELERMGADPAVRDLYEAEEKAKMVDLEQLENARAEGIAVGIAEGKSQGIVEGAVRHSQDLLLRMGEARLGKPSDRIVQMVLRNTSVADLDAKALRLFAVESWDDLLP